MPVNNQEIADNQNPAKYILYYSSTFDGIYKRSYRTIIQSFRTQMKGLGAGSAFYLPQDQLNADLKEENLQVGMFIKILDGTVFWDDEYGSVGDELFIGTIDSITNDVFQGRTDRQGTIVFNEIGQYLSTQPLVWGEKKQIFNPIIEGRCFGNKKPDESDFETIVEDMETTDANSKFQPTDASSLGTTINKRVWSLENVFDYLATKYTFDIVYPWNVEKRFYERERDNKIANYKILPGDSLEVQQQKQAKIDEINDQHNSDMELREFAYQYFKNSVDVRSYENFDGKNLPQMLNELLEEPFTWRLKYLSTSAPTIEIINKSVVDIPGICPAGYKQKRILDNTIIENFNITEDAEVYDQIVYRGNNILFCGTITPWIYAQGQSIDPDWTSTEEFSWIRGGNGKDAANEKEATIFRDTLPNVYRKFKFKYYDQDCYFRIVKKLKNDGSYEQAPFFVWESGGGVNMVPFFERVDFTKTEDGFTYVLPEPKLYDSISLHKSPSKLQFKWADKLPFEAVEGKLKEPFVIATTYTTQADGVTNDTIIFIDLTKPGGGYDTCGIKFNTDGFYLEMNTPETLGSNRDLLFEVGNGIIRRTKSEWDSSYPSSRNPLTTEYKYMTSWESLAMTVAAYSDQQLEYIVTKPGSTIIKKKKIIEDPSLECHIVHAGTIKKLREGTFEIGNPNSLRPVLYNGFERFERDTFVRNDFPKLKQYADQAAQWLFVEKRAVRIENHLQLYPSGSWNVGDLIGSINDDNIVHNINSAVESIEYDAVMNRVRISTAIPIMPELKRLRQQPISQGNIAPVTDTKAPRINATKKIITLEEQPTIGYAIGGTGSSISALNAWVIIRGQEMLPSGYYGVKKLAALPATVPTWIEGDIGELLSHNTYPDGIGLMRNVVTGNYQLVVNVSGLSFLNGEAPKGSVYGLSIGNFEQIQVAGTGTNPITNPARFVSFASIIYGR